MGTAIGIGIGTGSRLEEPQPGTPECARPSHAPYEILWHAYLRANVDQAVQDLWRGTAMELTAAEVKDGGR